MTATLAPPPAPPRPTRRGRMITPLARLIAPASLERTDRPAWLALRREGIGGSDIGPITGMAGYGRTAWQVYLDKTGAIPLDDRPEDGSRWEELTWFGHEMEAVAAKRFRVRHPGVTLRRAGMLARADAPWMRVNLDRIVTGCELGSPCLWEGKNRNAYTSAEWDRGGDPEKAPDGPVLQTHWGLIVTGYSHGHLSAVIGGNELREYVIRASDPLHDTLVGEAEWFWHDCVQAGMAPPIDAAERTGRILAELWEADPDAVKVATPEIEAKWRQLDTAESRRRDAEDEAGRLKHELCEWLAESVACLAPDGETLFTWKQNGTFKADQFRTEADPETWAAYARQAWVPDTAKLAEDDEALYTRYRARRFDRKTPDQVTRRREAADRKAGRP